MQRYHTVTLVQFKSSPSPVLRFFSACLKYPTTSVVHDEFPKSRLIVRSEPRRRTVPFEKQSRRQQLTRLNFKEATVYARTVTRDPEKKAYYARKAKTIGVRSPYSAAISDYLRGLTIESVDTRRYSGKANGQVKVTVRKKDFAAKEVNITIKTMAGEIIEQGKAMTDSNGAWIHKNVKAAPERTVVIEIEALNWNGQAEKKTNTLVLG